MCHALFWKQPQIVNSLSHSLLGPFTSSHSLAFHARSPFFFFDSTGSVSRVPEAGLEAGLQRLAWLAPRRREVQDQGPGLLERRWSSEGGAAPTGQERHHAGDHGGA